MDCRKAAFQVGVCKLVPIAALDASVPIPAKTNARGRALKRTGNQSALNNAAANRYGLDVTRKGEK
jgi:hypothetical protein